MATVVKGDLVDAASYTRHDHFEICFAEVFLCNSFARISKIELSADCHCFLDSPPIPTDCSPFTIMKHFNSTLPGICTPLDSNLQEKEKKKQCYFSLCQRNTGLPESRTFDELQGYRWLALNARFRTSLSSNFPRRLFSSLESIPSPPYHA